MIPFLDLKYLNVEIEDELNNNIQEIVKSNKYILGKYLNDFEAKFSKYCESKYSIGVGNGLDALIISLKSLGIKKGDEIIVPSNTYIATWLAVSAVGAIPVPVEPHFETMNIDVNLIERKINKKTVAILPVHLFGQPCNMDVIMKIANKYSLWVIEDFAQAHGAKFKSIYCGNFGHINGTSFYPTKNLGALGDGGAITTSDKFLSDRCKMIRNYGSKTKYKNEIIGVNSRLDEIQAASLILKLKHINKWNIKRKEIASWYFDFLRSQDNILLPENIDGAESVYHLFVIRTKNRNYLQKKMFDKGVETMIHYPIPPHLQKAYSFLNYKMGDFPITEMIAKTSLSLPLYVGLSKDKVSYISDLVRKFS